ncbi:uncharacterized protein LOC123551841 [Mercenaria mercenaria]|uniref:uncharacterized protein LOC123551841 n=1 Tax=Mercenaria mercenaria TaxID=6596 RepID=UPI00234F2FC6|nr:uncharacterized protein LOC123551841 [Mercenaria mercenaria]XP_045196995.2 uncharacterized protein LOC123551841 [Mercenaria mercenaria]
MDNSFGNEEENEDVGTCYDFTKKTWRDDVTFLVEDQHLYATKAVLAMVSSVFEAMFGTNFRERDENEVPLPGKRFEDFKEFLHCIYPTSQKKIDEGNVYKVLPLADEYDVKPLIKTCKSFLNTHLINDRASTEEVILCHGLAARHKFQSLRKVCATRLSDVGVKEIESTAVGVSDTETLLQIHKDILKQQGETLEETRTELVNIYINTDLSGPELPSISDARGSIIKFKPNVNSLDEQGNIYSNQVTLWDITFRVKMHVVTSTQGEKIMSLFLYSTFPRNNRLGVCRVNVKICFKRTVRHGPEVSKYVRMPEMVFSNESRTTGLMTPVALSRFTSQGYAENGILDFVVFLMSRKPSVRD